MSLCSFCCKTSPGKFRSTHHAVLDRLVGVDALHSGFRLVTADGLRRTTIDALRSRRRLLQPGAGPSFGPVHDWPGAAAGAAGVTGAGDGDVRAPIVGATKAPVLN